MRHLLRSYEGNYYLFVFILTIFFNHIIKKVIERLKLFYFQIIKKGNIREIIISGFICCTVSFQLRVSGYPARSLKKWNSCCKTANPISDAKRGITKAIRPLLDNRVGERESRVRTL